MAMNVSAGQASRGARGGRRGRRGGRAPMAEINVTPFVDVMLVLLVIFMSTGQALTSGVDVRLPTSTEAGELSVPRTPPTAVSVDATGQRYYGEEAVDFAALIARLAQARDEEGATQVYLRADGAVPYEIVSRLIAELSAAGFASIAFIMQEGAPPPDASEATVVDVDEQTGPSGSLLDRIGSETGGEETPPATE